MEPLMTKNDNFSFSFYKSLLEKMKNMKDKRSPDDDLANQVNFPTVAEKSYEFKQINCSVVFFSETVDRV